MKCSFIIHLTLNMKYAEMIYIQCSKIVHKRFDDIYLPFHQFIIHTIVISYQILVLKYPFFATTFQIQFLLIVCLQIQNDNTYIFSICYLVVTFIEVVYVIWYPRYMVIFTRLLFHEIRIFVLQKTLKYELSNYL